MKEVVLELTGLDLIFLTIALVSLLGNVIQFMIWWRDQKNLYQPISKTLTGLFNDIKNKATHAMWVQNTLFNANNPHKDVETIRWEYGTYAQTVWNYLQGFQEAVVAVLVSLDPEDKDGKAAFRASDYGLTDEEKAIRRQNLESLRLGQLQQHEASAEEAAVQDVPPEPALDPAPNDERQRV